VTPLIESAAPVESASTQRDDRARMHEASHAFEALLMQILLRTMREAQLEEGFCGEGAGASTYEGIVETNLADLLASSSPLGIANQIEEQWAHRADAGREVQDTLRDLGRLRAEQAYAAPDAAIPASRTDMPAPRAPGVSSEFGWRTDPLDGTRRFHGGVDLPAAPGTPVLAVAPGRVVSVGRRGGYGLQVVIEHGAGWATRYAHLSAASVSPGQWVGRRDALGQVGDSGRTTGPHLHFEARRFGRTVDPETAVPGELRIQVLPRNADE
jgi:murein DD-endopeptidase MepM/ murein hydrolase activator NlpD